MNKKVRDVKHAIVQKVCVWGGGDISDYPELQLFDFSISTTHTHTHAHSTVRPSKTQLLDKLIIYTVRDPQAWGPWNAEYVEATRDINIGQTSMKQMTKCTEHSD